MKTFTQWAQEEKKELPVTSEDASRGGIASWAYPKAYKAGQYLPGYFMSHSADAAFKLGKDAKATTNQPHYKLPPA